MNSDIAQAVWQQLATTDPAECWIWLGSRGREGYARLRHKGQEFRVHRWMYEHLVAPIPDGLVIDHLCRMPPCVNPAHMEPVTIRINTERGNGATAEALRAFAVGLCGNGHELRSVGLHKSGKSVTCAQCGRDRVRRYQARRRGLTAAVAS